MSSGQNLPSWGEVPVPHWVGWKQHSTFTSPQPSSARSALTTSAVETDLDAKFQCGIFQTARKSDGLVMMSWKMLGLEQLSQAARSEAIVLSSWYAQAKKITSIQKSSYLCFQRNERKIETSFFKVKSTAESQEGAVAAQRLVCVPGTEGGKDPPWGLPEFHLHRGPWKPHCHCKVWRHLSASGWKAMNSEMKKWTGK